MLILLVFRHAVKWLSRCLLSLICLYDLIVLFVVFVYLFIRPFSAYEEGNITEEVEL